MVRLAHYPHNENMIRLAEKWGNNGMGRNTGISTIEFSMPGVSDKMDLMMREMVDRDKTDVEVIVWSLSNETSPSPARTSIS